MIKLVLASRNRKKIAELQALLSANASEEVKLLSLDDIGFTQEIEETGATFEENALIKARAAFEFSGIGAIADDSGLCVDALDGAPGVYSARFAADETESGELKNSSDEANNQKLLRLLEATPDDKRSARFVCVIACVLPGLSDPIVVRGTAEGVILREYLGEGGFGYDPLFYYPPLEKSFAQLTSDEKNSVSHRGAAMRGFIRLFREYTEAL